MTKRAPWPMVVPAGTTTVGTARVRDDSRPVMTTAQRRIYELTGNGQPRWKLDKNGTITLNGANGGSGYMTLNDSTLLVYDNNGTLRVRLGLW